MEPLVLFGYRGVMKHNNVQNRCLATCLSSIITAGLFGSFGTAEALDLRNAELGVSVGVAHGFSASVTGHMANVIGPVGLRLNGAFDLPQDFIRDGVDLGVGTPYTLGTFATHKAAGMASESGHAWRFAVDGTYKLGTLIPDIELMGYAGGRYGMFTINEQYKNQYGKKYKSGQTSAQAFGFGAGAVIKYTAFDDFYLFADLGMDHYMSGDFYDGPEQKTYTVEDRKYHERRERYVLPNNIFKAKLGIMFRFD